MARVPQNKARRPGNGTLSIHRHKARTIICRANTLKWSLANDDYLEENLLAIANGMLASSVPDLLRLRTSIIEPWYLVRERKEWKGRLGIAYFNSQRKVQFFMVWEAQARAICRAPRNKKSTACFVECQTIATPLALNRCVFPHQNLVRSMTYTQPPGFL